MKKVGIINYQYSNHNYGAVLQAAALHYYVNSILGFNCEHINYIPQDATSVKTSHIKNALKAILVSLGIIEKKIEHNSFKNPSIFEDFRVTWLPRTETTFRSFEELKATNFLYTDVIVGSDQVWRPSYTSNSSLVYFLAFLDSNINRISYAASFGNDNWELAEADTQEILTEIKKFKEISVRELSGVDICTNTFGVHASHVLDPTLLVGREFFENIIGEQQTDKSEGTVYYKLDIDAKFERYLNLVSEKFNMQPTNIYYTTKGRSHYYREVDKWLREIRNSELVITDSFHCICFAILFEKPFVYYPNDNRGLTRLESILKLLKLEHLIYRDGMDLVELTKESMCIDYKVVNERLQALRAISSVFLTTALTE